MSPVAIGGLGGSGTRVFAEILSKCNVYIGFDLDIALDNLLFTYLLKRPQWFTSANNIEIQKRLRIFENFMIKNVHKIGIKNLLLFSKLVISDIFKASISPYFIINRLERLLFFRPKFPKYNLWGWKEPNNHIYLKFLAKYFDNFKYIHIIRNGLDMAYSKNKQQLYNWGHLYGIEIPQKKELVNSAQLEYWIRANKKSINQGKKLLGNSFLIINFDDFCANPRVNILELIEFLNLEIEEKKVRELCKIPRIPSSTGRWKLRDPSIFTDKQIDEVRALGFDVDL